ncbi:MAG: hypothetical protein CSB44_11210 [Gammaproteobacteria bacterium]|nr:MAG: hypothetical protein CSB44_11210 [Gammaproteobacteria bacterium]
METCMNLKPRARPALASVCLMAALLTFGTTATAFGDQWYLGLGGGASLLEPKVASGAADDDDNVGTLGSVIVGRDLDFRSSVEMQIRSLGSAGFENNADVDYLSLDGALLYRLFDSRGRGARARGFGASLYGRFALGYITRDADVALRGENAVNFGAGAGVEVYLGQILSLRAEGNYHDNDASSATLALVARFGGRRRGPLPPLPDDLPLIEPEPKTAADTSDEQLDEDGVTMMPGNDSPLLIGIESDLPPGAARNRDTDGDGVDDAADRCDNSTPGYPVRDDGCALFNGVLKGLDFATGTDQLEPGADEQLDRLAKLLDTYPDASVSIFAHTDNSGSEAEQTSLTRSRLLVIGRGLIDRGVSAKRLNLRSFGGSRPLHDNSTPEGRERNNRIEILEHPPE